VVLTDFGIASTIESGASTGSIVGSPGYMAPEHVHGGRVEPASDLFSLGATLYAAVEGRSPFGKGCTAATLDAVVTDPPAPLRRAGPIGPVIEGLLAKDPARRLGPDQTRSALQAITGTTSPPCPVNGVGRSRRSGVVTVTTSPVSRGRGTSHLPGVSQFSLQRCTWSPTPRAAGTL
jgi:serine/threonine protein kinase